MGESGSVGWNFEIKGYIVIKCGHMQESEKFGGEDIYVEDDVEEVMLKIMEIEGVLDIEEIDLDGVKGLEIYTEYSSLASVRDRISELGYVLVEAELIKEAKTLKELTGEELKKVKDSIERIEDNDDVQSVWSNLKE